MKNDFKGYPLFNDIEDKALQTRNRAVIMANIAEANTKKNLMTPKGAFLILSYFDSLPAEDKKDVETAFKQNLKERGYSV